MPEKENEELRLLLLQSQEDFKDQMTQMSKN
jgi:hypothetical protein